MDFKRSSQRFFEKKKDRLFETWKIRHFKVERKVLKRLKSFTVFSLFPGVCVPIKIPIFFARSSRFSLVVPLHGKE